MKTTGKRAAVLAIAFMSSLCALLFVNSRSFAAQQHTVTFYNGNVADTVEADHYVEAGDTGTVILADYNMNFSLLSQIVRKEFISDNAKVVSIDDKGNFVAAGGGRAVISAYGYNAAGVRIFSASCAFGVYEDMSGVNLAENSITGYLVNGQSAVMEVAFQGNPDLTYYTLEYEAIDGWINIQCSLSGSKKLILTASQAGTVKLSIVLNNRTYYLDVTVKNVTMKSDSALLTSGGTKQMKLKGYSGKVKWKSMNKKIARVTSKGLVKGKKTGNTVVYTTVKGQRIGCAISVVKTKYKKVVSSAKQIAKTCQYSQEKRMQSGYYDCSSLVWKSYRKIGKNFGNSSYAPVAADIAKWCVTNKKKIQGGLSAKNISAMKLRPGDLMFECGANNGRYKGIYHVEMFVGYSCQGFDGEEPVLGTLWAARPSNYYYQEMMVRP